MAYLQTHGPPFEGFFKVWLTILNNALTSISSSHLGSYDGIIFNFTKLTFSFKSGMFFTPLWIQFWLDLHFIICGWITSLCELFVNHHRCIHHITPMDKIHLQLLDSRSYLTVLLNRHPIFILLCSCMLQNAWSVE